MSWPCLQGPGNSPWLMEPSLVNTHSVSEEQQQSECQGNTEGPVRDASQPCTEGLRSSEISYWCTFSVNPHRLSVACTYYRPRTVKQQQSLRLNQHPSRLIWQASAIFFLNKGPDTIFTTILVPRPYSLYWNQSFLSLKYKSGKRQYVIVTQCSCDKTWLTKSTIRPTLAHELLLGDLCF